MSCYVMYVYGRTHPYEDNIESLINIFFVLLDFCTRRNPPPTGKHHTWKEFFLFAYLQDGKTNKLHTIFKQCNVSIEETNAPIGKSLRGF